MNTGNTLRERVRGERDRQEGGGEVATRNEGPKTIKTFIDGMVGEMSRALPRHMTADRMARIVLTEVRRVPDLAKCTQASFGGALMTCAQLGLEPGVTGEAYLIPFRNRRKNCYEVQLIIGYQGMVKLYWQSPLARSLDAQTVYENDDFDYAYGLDPKLSHTPKLTGDRGNAIAYYAVARLNGGGSAFIVMSKSDVERIRARAQAKSDGPWATDYDAMARKTAIRQLFKLLPRSPELSQAMTHDGAVRTDLSEQAIDIEPEYPDAVEGEIVDDAPQGQAEVADPEPAPRQPRQRRQQEASVPAEPDDPGPSDPGQSQMGAALQAHETAEQGADPMGWPE